MEYCTSTLGEILDWPVAHVYKSSSDRLRLEPADVWHLRDAEQYVAFCELTRATFFDVGEGLVGRVFVSGEPEWVADVREDPDFRRTTDDNPDGIVSAIAFPVHVAGDAVAVVEFFTDQKLEPDPKILKTCKRIAANLGMIIERQRWESERLALASIVASSFDAIIGRSLDGTIVSWNKGAESLYGFRAHEAIGKTTAITLPEGVLEEVELENAHRDGSQVHQFEAIRQNRDGEKLHVSITVSPIRDASNRLVGSSSIERDITRRKRYESDLRAAKEAAEAASRTKSEFMANISHELRTPMNAILGMTELSLHESLPDVVRDYLTTVKDSADTLLYLVNDILDFSRLEAGRFELEPVTFNLRVLLDECMRTMSLRAHEKGLELACQIDHSLPRTLVGDPMRLRQIVTNLTSNALKFTEQGEVVVRCRTASQDATLEFGSDVELEFCVSDTGIGISSDDQEAIFAPFTQADASTTRQYSGTGLGLSICSELTELMGGRLWVDSEVGKGSDFYFTVELKVGDEADDEQILRDATPLENMPVLVVDDNDTNRTILNELLSNWSMEPKVVPDAEHAIDELETAAQDEKPYPLVIVDALMPGTDGFMLLEEAGNKDVLDGSTILMLSSADRQVFSDRCEDLEIAAYLEKPVSQSSLLDAIVTALDGATATDKAPEFAPVFQSLNLLVAEDTPANQKVLRAMLTRRGHSVKIAHNGREAIDRLQSGDFDLVLMDIQMPTMDGIQATQAIRDSEAGTDSHIPIIAMTAHAMRGDREACLEAGMDDYISKPINYARLIKLVERIGSKGESIAQPPSSSTAEQTSSLAEELVWNEQAALERLGDDKTLLSNLITYFFEDSGPLREAIESAIQSGQPAEVERAAHSLKGLCANFEANVARAAAADIEKQASTGNGSQSDYDLTALDHHLEELRKSLALWQAEQ